MNATKRERLAVPVSRSGARPNMPERQELRLSRILVPRDLAGKSRQALEFAMPLAVQYSGKISLIHVIEPPPAYWPYPGESGVEHDNSRALEDSSHERLAALSRDLLSRELLARTIVRRGRTGRLARCHVEQSRE